MNKRKILLLYITAPVSHKVNHPVHVYPPLPLKYIQSILSEKKNIEVKLIDNRIKNLSINRLQKKVIEYKSEILVLFGNFVTPDLMLNFSERAKKFNSNLFTIALGPVATWNIEKFIDKNSYVDIAIPGEGGLKIANIICNFHTKRKENWKILYKEKYSNSTNIELVQNLNQLPLVDYSKDELEQYPFIYPLKLNKEVRCGYIETSRGCNNRCIFCSQYIRKSYSCKVRTKSAERVGEEIEFLMRKGINFISFEDDDFTGVKEHVFSICEEIKKRDLKINWTAEVRVDEVDEELLKKMKSAGCEFLQFGVESGSERLIKLLEKSKKPEKWKKQVREAFYIANEIGISTCALFMIGIPMETEEEVRKSMKFAKRLNPDLVKLHFFCFYPGSRARKKFSEELGNKSKYKYMYHHAHPKVNLSKIDTDKLIKLRKKFYNKIYLDPKFILNHIFKYTRYYIKNLKSFKILISKILKLFTDRQ